MRSRERIYQHPSTCSGRTEETMKDAKAYPIDLESEKVRFLEQIVSSHGLADVGKAVRCLINYARENPDKHEEIFGEIRCLEC
jgi:hypothetical protein